VAAKRNGNNPQTFTTKVVKSAFTLFAMILGDWADHPLASNNFKSTPR